jgi:hypothetical protein
MHYITLHALLKYTPDILVCLSWKILNITLRKLYMIVYRMSKKCPDYVLWYYYVGIDVSYRFLVGIKSEWSMHGLNHNYIY